MNINVGVEHSSNRGVLFLRALAVRWRIILMMGILAVTIGLLLKSNWLIAAGVAPALLGLLPCAAMCALGLCMGGKKSGGGSCHTSGSNKEGPVQSKKELPGNEPNPSA